MNDINVSVNGHLLFFFSDRNFCFSTEDLMDDLRLIFSRDVY